MDQNNDRKVMVQQSWGGPAFSLTPNPPPGQYVNFIQIGASQWEFVCDFGVIESSLPLGQPTGQSPSPTAVALRPVVRLLMSPHNLKPLYETLGEAIRNYEAAWGIELPDLRERQAALQSTEIPPSAEKTNT